MKGSSGSRDLDASHRPTASSSRYIDAKHDDFLSSKSINADRSTLNVADSASNRYVQYNHQRSNSDSVQTAAVSMRRSRSHTAFAPSEDAPPILPASSSGGNVSQTKRWSHKLKSSSNQSLCSESGSPNLDPAIPLKAPGSPGSPPRKLWERHYRSFLSRKGMLSSTARHEEIPLESEPPSRIVRSNSVTSSNSSVSQQFTPTSPRQTGLRKLGNLLTGGHSPRTSKPTTSRSQIQIDSFQNKNDLGESTLTTGESSVRGGKLFGGMFKKNGGDHKNDSDRGFHHRKVHSNHELDGTLRNGSDKQTYYNNSSPVSVSQQPQLQGTPPMTLRPPAEVPVNLLYNPRFETLSKEGTSSLLFPPKTTNTRSMSETIIGSSSLTMRQHSPERPLCMPRPFELTEPSDESDSKERNSHLQGLEDDITIQLSLNQGRESRNAATPLPGNNQMKVSFNKSKSLDESISSATSSSSAIKKAFTEFHNSAFSGQDSVSAYLGDEPSSTKQNMFWAQKNQHFSYYSELRNLHLIRDHSAPNDHGASATETNSEEFLALDSEPVKKQRFSAAKFGSYDNLSRFGDDDNPFHSLRPATITGIKSTILTDTVMSSIAESASCLINPLCQPALLSSSSPARTVNSNLLETVHENVTIHKTMRMLRPIQGANVWQTGRRYLIAPAALAACSPTVISAFWRNNNLSVPNVSKGNGSASFELALKSASVVAQVLTSASNFGSVVLGECLLSYRPLPCNNTLQTEGSQEISSSSSSSAPTLQQWSSGILILRQNYLLEFDRDHDFSVSLIPRGYVHLHYATCHVHKDFSDAFQLHFYSSPCSKSDKRILLIRIETDSNTTVRKIQSQSMHATDITSNTSEESVNSRQKVEEERSYWMACLRKAASLSLHDLYEFPVHTLPDGTQSNGESLAVGDVGILGKGQYVTVRAARRRNDCQETTLHEASSINDSGEKYFNCALKFFDKNKFWKMVVSGRERADTLVREASVQATLSVKAEAGMDSFLRLRGFFETSDSIALEFELLDGTDLFQYISSKGVLNENEAAYVTRDILQCLRTMNRLGLAHRDIKPANILMCPKREGPDAPTGSLQYSTPLAKVADFGMSAFVGVDGHVRGRCGTPGYVAPEIFSAGLQGYSNKVDIFSTGVTLYVMLCGYEPFYGETEAELVAANKKSENVDFPEEEWAQVSPEAIDLVKRMMDPNPNTRCNAKQALLHPWLANKLTSCPVEGKVNTPEIDQLMRHPSTNQDDISGFQIGGAPCPPSRALNGEGACTIS